MSGGEGRLVKTLVFRWGSLLLLLLPAATYAGKNGGGAMIVHTNDAYTYMSGTACTTPLGEPAACEEAITRTDRSAGSVVWFLAAFAPESSPVLASVYFGVRYDSALLDPIVSYASCGPPGTLEIPDDGWPNEGTGTTIGFPSPISGDHMIPFYVFVIDNASETVGAYFGTGVNPLGGYAAFYDDSFPPFEDRCTRFGEVRWYEPGSNSCPALPQPGACCLPDASCRIVAYKDFCDDLHGVYLGDGSTCDSPCGGCCYWDGDPVQRYCVVTTQEDCADDSRGDAMRVDVDGKTIGSCWSAAGLPCATEPGNGLWCSDPRWQGETGACCLGDHCIICSWWDCETRHGIWLGWCPVCTPESCPPTSTLRSSWGMIKTLYR